MKEYKNIKNEVITDSENLKSNTVFYILSARFEGGGCKVGYNCVAGFSFCSPCGFIENE